MHNTLTYGAYINRSHDAPNYWRVKVLYAGVSRKPELRMRNY